MKTNHSIQGQVITLAQFTFTASDYKELNDKLNKMMEIIDKKFIESNTQYDTDMKCILDDDNYLRDLAELDLVNQVVTLYNDVFGVSHIHSPAEGYKHFIEVTYDIVKGKTRRIVFEIKSFVDYDHYTID
jgi:hypothetical protein